MKPFRIALIAIAVVAPAFAQADAPPTPPAADVLAYYPLAAKAAGVSGKAEITCHAAPTGALTDCVVTSESPPGQGFGAAALAIAAHAHKSDEPPRTPLDTTLPLPYRFTFSASPPSITPDLVGQTHMGDPSWLRRPTAEDFAAAYPPAAAARGVSGHTTMLCGVDANGGMTKCQLVSEAPNGQGFGAAALSLARYFKMSLFTSDGRPTAGLQVMIPIGWVVPR